MHQRPSGTNVIDSGLINPVHGATRDRCWSAPTNLSVLLQLKE